MICGMLLVVIMLLVLLLAIDVIQCSKALKEMAEMNAHLSKLVHDTKKVLLKHGK
jgi:hypothetical protein